MSERHGPQPDEPTHAGRRIAVAGATGRVGRHLVDVLAATGHDVVAMSRRTGVDLTTGNGLAEALRGVEVVVDASSGSSPDGAAATAFFTATARTLQSVAAAAGVRRIVVVSIIGADRFRGGYNAAKAVHERELRKGPLPVRVLRAAQFHELVEQMVAWGRRGSDPGVAHVLEMRTQLVAARTVAEALAGLATGPDTDEGTTEIAGPRAESLVEAARLLLAGRGEALSVEGVADPDDPDTPLYRGGALLPGPAATLAGPTFADWLAAAGRVVRPAGPG